MKKEKLFATLAICTLLSTQLANPITAFAESGIPSSVSDSELAENSSSESQTSSEEDSLSNEPSESKVEKTIPSSTREVEDSSLNDKLTEPSFRSLDNAGIVLSPNNLNKEMSATNIITFTYSIKTTSDKGINNGDKIILEIPSTGLNYDSIDVIGLPPYFTQSIDAQNNRIIFTATQDVNYESETATTFSVLGNPTKTAENTDVPKAISYPVSSSYVSTSGESVNLLPSDTALLVKNVSSNFSGATAAVYPGLENSKAFDNSKYTNNFKGMLNDTTGYFVSSQNAQLFSIGSFNTSKSPIKESTGHVSSNFEIDESTIRKSYLSGETSESITIVMDSDNKGFTYTMKDLPLWPNNGWSQYISFFVITNSPTDVVTVKNDYKIINELGSINQGTDEKLGIYGVNPSGKFIPRIIGEDTTVYISDPKLDLLTLVKATDIKDGDITKNIKIENNGGFNQSKPGEYSVEYSVINSDQITATKTIVVTVLYKDAKPVTVNYVDEEDNTLAESDTLNGKVGLPYETKAKSINGWTVKTTPDNATGTFSEEAQTVTYVYERTDAKPSKESTNNKNTEKNSGQKSSNSTGTKKQLPQTGEQHTTWLTVVGGVLLLVVGGFFYFRKKKSI